MVTLMPSLWLEQLGAEDRVSVKPHASPVLHALEYLLGQLDASWLTTLRQFGGLQSYPSRLKDPVPADYSTGSVGIGATAPIWGALARRYVNTQFGSGGTGRPGALVGGPGVGGGGGPPLRQHPVRQRRYRPAVVVGRRRRARRGGRLGGRARPLGRRARRGRLGRRLQPAVTRPRRPDDGC